MPDDLEVLWNQYVVFVQPVSRRGAEWLSGVMPRRSIWEMRIMSHDDIQGCAIAARKQGLTIGGVSVPISIEDIL